MRGFRFFFVLIVWAMALAQPAAAGDAEAPLHLVADLWCPFTCSPQAAQPGLLVEVVQHALPGHTSDYELAGWSRVLQMDSAAPAPVLLVLGLGRSPTVTARYRLSRQPVLNSPPCFFRRRGDPWHYAGIGSLRGLQVGITRGYQYEDSDMAAFLAQVNRGLVHELSGADASERHLEMLVHGRNDVVLEDRAVMRWSMRQHPASGAQVQEAGCLKGRDAGVYVGVLRSDPRGLAVLQAFDRGFQALQAHGQLAPLLKAYGLEKPSAP